MKYIIILLLLTSSFISCNKETEFILSAETLEQTVWEGVCVSTNMKEGEAIPWRVTLFFVTKQELDYATRQEDFPGVHPPSPGAGRLSYSVDRDVFIISSSEHLISGTWLITHKDKNRLIMVRDLGTSYAARMTLSKTNL
jgi:hypothetical protein